MRIRSLLTLSGARVLATPVVITQRRNDSDSNNKCRANNKANRSGNNCNKCNTITMAMQQQWLDDSHGTLQETTTIPQAVRGHMSAVYMDQPICAQAVR